MLLLEHTTHGVLPRPLARPLAFLILVMICVGGCDVQTGTTSVSDSTLVLVLADLHVIDAEFYLDARGSNDDRPGTPLIQSGAARDSVLNRHGLTYAQYQASMEELIDDPDRFLAIYQDVLDRLSVRASR